jgi:hypothetical protein
MDASMFLESLLGISGDIVVNCIEFGDDGSDFMELDLLGEIDGFVDWRCGFAM